MNLKRAKRIRSWVKGIMKDNNIPVEKTTQYQYMGKDNQQCVVKHNTFRGMYRLAKRQLTYEKF